MNEDCRAYLPGEVVRLHVIGGACNRLQSLLSYRAVHGSLDVVWQPNEYVSNACFEDVFHPIDGVRFIHPSEGWDREDWAIHPDAPSGWMKHYALLKPVEAVVERIEQLRKELGDYVAIHARRTDHTTMVTELIKDNCTTDDELLRFTHQWPACSVYLATDNGDTQKRWLDASSRVRVGHQLPGSENQGLDDHHRNGTLTEAVVDLFVCANAIKFMGTKHSSFSETIDRLRGFR